MMGPFGYGRDTAAQRQPKSKFVATGLFGLLLACSGPVEKAEEEHRVAMAASPTEDEKCRIEQKLAEAYLTARESEKYENQKRSADIQCLMVETERNMARYR